MPSLILLFKNKNSSKAQKTRFSKLHRLYICKSSKIAIIARIFTTLPNKYLYSWNLKSTKSEFLDSVGDSVGNYVYVATFA